MAGARLDRDHVTAGRLDGTAGDLDRERAGDHLERLGLVRMDVSGGEAAARLDESLEPNVFAARVARRFVEDEPLAGERVLDCLS